VYTTKQQQNKHQRFPTLGLNSTQPIAKQFGRLQIRIGFPDWSAWISYFRMAVWVSKVVKQTMFLGLFAKRLF
jgi:hypothetical protein